MPLSGLRNLLFGEPGRMMREPLLTGRQEQLMQALMGDITGRIGEVPEGYRRAMEVAQEAIGPSPEIEQAISRALAGEPAAEYSPEAAEQYFREAVQAPMEREAERQRHEVAEEFAGPGTFWGGARMGAQADVQRGLEEALMGERARVMMGERDAQRQAQEAAQQRALQALGPAMQYQMAPMDMATQLAQLATGQEQLRQLPWQAGMGLLQIPEELMYWQEGREGIVPQLAQLAGAFMGLGG